MGAPVRVGVAALLAAGCNALSGVGDFHVEASPPSGASVASGGAGTTSSTSGAGGATSSASGGGGAGGATSSASGAGNVGASTSSAGGEAMASGSSSSGKGGGGTAGAGGTGGSGGAGGGVCGNKRVFVTSEGYLGNFALGKPDAWQAAKKLCQDHAQAAGLGGTWEPWLSVGSVGAIDMLTGTGPWFLVDCVTKVANDKADLVDGAIASPISTDETGASAGAEVWTGTIVSGTPHPYRCQDWTSSLVSGRRGKAQSADKDWTDSTNGGCNGFRRLYCFES